jgi:hypothetical protein
MYTTNVYVYVDGLLSMEATYNTSTVVLRVVESDER